MPQFKGAAIGLVAFTAMIISVGAYSGVAQADHATAAPAAKNGPVSRPLYVTRAPVIMLKDVDSGAILFSRGAEQRFAPASMTKTMTAYVILRLIKEGSVKPSDEFVMTAAIWRQWQARRGNSSMFLKVGERVTVDHLLHGLLTVSGNDAATLLAVGIDGSEDAFVARMNRVAADIGMKNSSFGNPSGWMDGGKTMVTAEDMILLADRLIRDHPAGYTRYFSQPTFEHGVAPNGQPIVRHNSNPILGRFPGADGLKTGFTNEAGFCFLGSAKRDGRRLIMIVAGMDSSRARRDEAERLLTWGFEAWEGRVIAKAGSPMITMDVNKGSSPTVVATNTLDLRITVPRGHSGRYHAVIQGETPVTAPFMKGAPLAKFIVTPAGLPSQETPLVSANSVERGGALSQARTGFYRMTGI